MCCKLLQKYTIHLFMSYPSIWEMNHLWMNEFLVLKNVFLTLFRMYFFGTSYRWVGEGGAKGYTLPKICHTYPAMMKLGTVIPYLRRICKIYESRDKPLEFCWHQYFSTKNQQILLYQEIQIWIVSLYIISHSFSFPWVFKNCGDKHS